VDDYLIRFLKILPFQVIIVSNDKFRDYIVPQILENWDWRLEPNTRGTSVYIPKLRNSIENMLNIMDLTEHISNSKYLVEEVYSL